MRKVFPDHWSFLLGEIALYSFIILLLTGVYPDAVTSTPRMTEVVYHGAYAPLRGQCGCPRRTPRRWTSRFDVRGGLLIRQIHHWAALVFIAAHARAHAAGLLHRRVPQAA